MSLKTKYLSLLDKVNNARAECIVYGMDFNISKLFYMLAFMAYLLIISIKLGDINYIELMSEGVLSLAAVVYMLITFGTVFMITSRLAFRKHKWDYGITGDFITLMFSVAIMFFATFYVGIENYSYLSSMVEPNLELIESIGVWVLNFSNLYRVFWYSLAILIVVKCVIGFSANERIKYKKKKAFEVKEETEEEE